MGLLNMLQIQQHPISIEVYQFLNFKRAKDKHPYQTTFVMYHHFAVLKLEALIIISIARFVTSQASPYQNSDNMIS